MRYLIRERAIAARDGSAAYFAFRSGGWRLSRT